MRKRLEDTLSLNKEILINDYANLKSLRAIAIKYNTSHNVIRDMFTRFNIEYRKINKTTKLPFNENYFFEFSEKAYYWAGFLAADGCVYKNYLKLGLEEKDYNHLIKFRESVNAENHKLSKSINKHSNRNDRWKDSVCYTLSLCSNKIIYDIKKYNIIPNKSKKLEFPKNLIDNKLNIFCRGYFDGDGCWCYHKAKTRPNRKPQLTFSLRGTEQFLKKFNEVMVYQSKLPAICFDKKISITNNIGSITYIGNNICKNIAIWLYSDILIQDTNLYLDRKYKFIKHLLNI
jgi:hypothetical protein